VGEKAEFISPDRRTRSQPFYLAITPEGDGRLVRVKNPWVWPDEPPFSDDDSGGPQYLRV
jgi:hypothetical protein